MVVKHFIFLSAVIFIVTACGKKTKETRAISDRQATPLETELEKFLNKQEIICDGGKLCPDYLTKIVVIDGDTRRFCTGFLTDSETVATSTSCLPELMRHENQDCSQNIFLFFPRSFNRPAERISCKRVLKVSQLESKDPVLWRNDTSFLEIEKSVFRRPLMINREGLPDHKGFILWTIDPVDNFIGIIRRAECEAAHRTYFNPLVTDESSPNMIFAGCPYKNGNSGSPIIDYRGRLRAMVSSPVDSQVINTIKDLGLLIRPLKEVFHATNFACAPTIYDTETLNQMECSKELSFGLIDEARKRMILSENLYDNVARVYETTLNGTNRYIKFGVKLIVKDNGEREAEIFPRCFKDASTWISELSVGRGSFSFEIDLPLKSFKRIMNEDGRVEAVEQSHGTAVYNYQFNPRILRNTQQATLYMWSPTSTAIYPDLKETCPSLL